MSDMSLRLSAAWPGSASTSASGMSTPDSPSEPSYTIVDKGSELRAMLDTIVQKMNLPAKSYAKAHTRSATDPAHTTTKESKSSLGPAAIPKKVDNMSERNTPNLYIDIEGVSLSRHGELSILIVHIETKKFSYTYLIHVHHLGRCTFYTRSTDGVQTLRSILEDNRIPKVFFDVRMDSDALYGQYGVLLGGVIDLQLMNLARRQGVGAQLPSLEDCFKRDLDFTKAEMKSIRRVKEEGRKLWHPKRGGSMERFNDSPLLQGIIDYCVADAKYLPTLFSKYNEALGNRVDVMVVDELWGNEDLKKLADGVFSWQCRVLKESRARVRLALDSDFKGGNSANPWYEWHPCSLVDELFLFQ